MQDTTSPEKSKRFILQLPQRHRRWLVCYCLSNSYRLWRGVVTAFTLIRVRCPWWTVVI